MQADVDVTTEETVDAAEILASGSSYYYYSVAVTHAAADLVDVVDAVATLASGSSYYYYSAVADAVEMDSSRNAF